MNYKLFNACLVITFGMLFWLIFQTGSMNFIAIRVVIAFVSVILMFFSVNWYEKNGWRKTALVLIAILGVGSIAHFSFNWGMVNHPGITLISMAVTAVLILFYIKFLEPRLMRKFAKK